MIQFFINGGVPMVFVLALGLIGLSSAARFVRSPDRRKVPAVVALSVASCAAALAGVASDVMVFTHAVASRDELRAQAPEAVLQGLSESMSPLVLGGTLLCVTWMVMAAGFRRLAVISP